MVNTPQLRITVWFWQTSEWFECDKHVIFRDATQKAGGKKKKWELCINSGNYIVLNIKYIDKIVTLKSSNKKLKVL